MASATTDNTAVTVDGILGGLGVLAAVVGVVWVLTNSGSFVFLPMGLLGVLLVAGGALLLTAGLLGHLGMERLLGTLLTVLVVVSAIVAAIVVGALAVA